MPQSWAINMGNTLSVKVESHPQGISVTLTRNNPIIDIGPTILDAEVIEQCDLFAWCNHRANW